MFLVSAYPAGIPFGLMVSIAFMIFITTLFPEFAEGHFWKVQPQIA
jgi:hypothetical protein